MKWVSGTINLSKITRTARDLGTAGRVFATVSAFTFFFFVLMGLAGVLHDKLPKTSMPAMKGAAVALSSQFFVDMMALEIPHMKSVHPDSAFSQRNVTGFLVQYLTGINPEDPKSLLAGAMPGLRGDSANVLYSGQATRPSDQPFDSTPPAGVFEEKPAGTAAPSGTAGTAGASGGTDIPSAVGVPSPGPSPAETAAPPASPGAPAAAPTPGGPGVEATAGTGAGKPAPALGTNGKKVVLIYHSHNRESFLPELKGVKSPDLAYSTENNITTVGAHLAQRLEELGIGTQHSTTDYPSTVKDFSFAKSYAYSSLTVKEALATNRDLKMVFDIHRDSLNRDKTTATIDGKDYAQVFFVVGKRNPAWEKNSDFAGKLHAQLEKEYPGISKGVYGKSSHGNAEYNQSLFDSSVLIEIGGPYNSLVEMNRTADLLAEVIADLYWEAEKVTAPAAGQ